MTDYNGQLIPQQYAIDVGQSPMQAMHTSPQQQQTHMVQPAPMLAQQQMIMQQSQPVHLSSCNTMSVHQMAPPQMMSQPGVPMLSQPSQMSQQGGGQGGMMSGQQHQILASQMASQQANSQMVVTSMGHQQMMTVTQGQQLQTQQAQASLQIPVSHQMTVQGPQTPHQIGPHGSSTAHQLGVSPAPSAASAQQHTMITSASTQVIQQPTQAPQHAIGTPQPIGQSPSFAHPGQPHMQAPNSSFQQASPHRQVMSRYPTPSPENLPHATPMYRSPMQRTPSATRAIGQSSAIRQALGHLPAPASTASSVADHPIVPSSSKLIDKETMNALIKTVDPLETVEDDVSDALLQLVDEFLCKLIDQAARVAKHRGSLKVEPKDVQYVLERRYYTCTSLQTASSTQSLERNFRLKSPATEAHRQRMALIKKTILKP